MIPLWRRWHVVSLLFVCAWREHFSWRNGALFLLIHHPDVIKLSTTFRTNEYRILLLPKHFYTFAHTHTSHLIRIVPLCEEHFYFLFFFSVFILFYSYPMNNSKVFYYLPKRFCCRKLYYNFFHSILVVFFFRQHLCLALPMALYSVSHHHRKVQFGKQNSMAKNEREPRARATRSRLLETSYHACTTESTYCLI